MDLKEKSPTPPRESFQLQITAEPGHWQSIPEMRLKALLKSLHRSYGFRCDSCIPLKTAQVPPKTPSCSLTSSSLIAPCT
jgi:hypothetical protein